MTDNAEWLDHIEGQLTEDQFTMLVATDGVQRLIRLARKGLAAEKLAKAAKGVIGYPWVSILPAANLDAWSPTREDKSNLWQTLAEYEAAEGGA